MVLVGRLASRMTPTRPTTLEARIGERVKAVGQNADGAAGVAEHDLRDRDRQIQHQDADEYGSDRRIAVGANGRGREAL